MRGAGDLLLGDGGAAVPALAGGRLVAVINAEKQRERRGAEGAEGRSNAEGSLDDDAH